MNDPKNESSIDTEEWNPSKWKMNSTESHKLEFI